MSSIQVTATDAKQAALLNGGSLDGAHITVVSEADHPESDDEHHDEHPIQQSDKPRAGSESVLNCSLKCSSSPVSPVRSCRRVPR